MQRLLRFNAKLFYDGSLHLANTYQTATVQKGRILVYFSLTYIRKEEAVREDRLGKIAVAIL